jgi:hypothetical protein
VRRLSLTETSIPVPETGFDDPELAAVSQVIQFQNWNEPTQVHLALTGDPTEMIAMWVSKEAYTPEVRWGIETGKYTHTVELYLQQQYRVWR